MKFHNWIFLPSYLFPNYLAYNSGKEILPQGFTLQKLLLILCLWQLPESPSSQSRGRRIHLSQEMVVADAVAARLQGVADEGRLLIAPYALRSHHQHHDPEDEDDRQPDTADGGGMSVHTAEQGVQACPIHPASFTPAR